MPDIEDIKIHELEVAPSIDKTNDYLVVSKESTAYTSGYKSFKATPDQLLAAAGVSTLESLTDVEVETPTNGEALMYSNGNWVNGEIPTSVSDLDDLGDVNISSVSNGQVLKYDNTSGKWVNANESAGSSALSSLTDVTITSVANGQVLKYDSTLDKWINGTGGGGASTLADLTDTAINNPKNSQMLIYDGTNHVWRNVAPRYGYDIAGTLEAGQTSITFTDAAILSDSYIQVFTPDGTEFNSITATTGSVTITFDVQPNDLSVCVRLT